MGLLYLLYLLLLGFVRLRGSRRRRYGNRRALLGYVGWGLLPALLYVGLFGALVGIEEWTGQALIAEPFARALPLVLIGGVAATLCGTVVVGLILLFNRNP